MFQKKHKGASFGSVLGSVLGSLNALTSKSGKAIHKGQEWMDKAKDFSETLLNEVKHFQEPKNKHTAPPPFVAGALIGLLLGAGAALLLSPKTGKQLRDKLTKQYGEIVDKANEILEHANRNPTVKTVKKKAAALSKNLKPKKTAVKKAVSKAKRKAKLS